MKTLLIRWIKKAWRNTPPNLRDLARPALHFFIRLRSEKVVRLRVGSTSVAMSFNSFSEYWAARTASLHEPEFLDKFMDLLSDNTTILDIGANDGFYSLVAAKVAPQSQVIAFEPNPLVRDQLKKNKALNKTDNIQILEYALGAPNSATEVNLTLRGDSSNLGDTSQGDMQSVTVTCVTADSLLDRELIPVPDIIKMDIEGYEYHALLGMQKLLETHRPIILLEVHPEYLVKFDTSEDILLSYLQALGYRAEELHERQKGKGIGHKQKHLFVFPAEDA